MMKMIFLHDFIHADLVSMCCTHRGRKDILCKIMFGLELPMPFSFSFANTNHCVHSLACYLHENIYHNTWHAIYFTQHPGNMIVDRNKSARGQPIRIHMIDCGLTVELGERDHVNMVKILGSLIKRDGYSAGKLMVDTSKKCQGSELDVELFCRGMNKICEDDLDNVSFPLNYLQLQLSIVFVIPL